MRHNPPPAQGEHADIAQRYWHDTLWSPSYLAASTGGPMLLLLGNIIEQHHLLLAVNRKGSGAENFDERWYR